MTRRAGGGLKSSIVKPRSLGTSERQRMFELFETYYEHITRERFCADLDAKDSVILLRSPDGAIQGFSTIRAVELEVDGRKERAVFSGDTVVARPYWGTRVLGKAFLAHLFRLKLERPTAPLWWFLISKGYKTYLLMANNFAEHYPRHEEATPAWAQHLLDGFAATLFPSRYDRERGLVVFEQSLGQLRQGVAGITPELRKNPRVAFFEARNPTWSEGTELACIARMTWSMPFVYAAKHVKLLVERVLGRSALSPDGEERAA